MLWMKRNEANKISDQLDPRDVAVQIRQIVMSHIHAWDYKVFDRGKCVGWTPPFPPNVKVNYDADVGFDRAFLCTIPLIAKARAALFAVQKMKVVGFTNVIFQGDSLIIAQAIQGIPDALYQSIDSIVVDIKLKKA